MKTGLLLISIFGILLSCAGRPAVIRPVIEKPGEAAIEKPPPAPAIEALLDSVLRLVKHNSPEIKKYFILDESGNIIVKADLTELFNENIEVIYHMKDFQGFGGYLVPFTVNSPEIDTAREDVLFWIPPKDAAGILLSLDDNYFEAWERYFDLFDRYNAKITFFVQGDNTAFCKAALERGHDVGYHTTNHLNLTKVDETAFRSEAISGAEVFRNVGLPLTSFAYPFGLSEPWMHEELLKHFKILRGYGVTFRLYGPSRLREGYSSSRAIDNILFKQDEDFETALNVMLRTVKFIGGDMILPLTTHDISDTASWGIKPQRLEYLLQMANELQLNFYRYEDLWE
jgi:peptidoglycan/xylan/chitin deacetylase (PgdA/CDA1 family)